MALQRCLHLWLVFVMVLCSVTAVSAQGLGDLPPRVVDCVPAAFATNVDAATKQIKFTFDRPMNTQSKGGIGSVRYAGVAPFGREVQPLWDATGTILTVPVELQPDVTYAVAINDSKNRGIADSAGAQALGFFLVFATGPRTADEFPPYVVKSEPENGAKDADFRTKQVTVTFSRPVAPGDLSWVVYRGSGEYPAPRDAGMPQLSADRLTATLDVRLSPDTVYAVGLNDPSYFGYKDTKGRPVLPYGICFKTAK